MGHFLLSVVELIFPCYEYIVPFFKNIVKRVLQIFLSFFKEKSSCEGYSENGFVQVRADYSGRENRGLDPPGAFGGRYNIGRAILGCRSEKAILKFGGVSYNANPAGARWNNAAHQPPRDRGGSQACQKRGRIFVEFSVLRIGGSHDIICL